MIKDFWKNGNFRHIAFFFFGLLLLTCNSETSCAFCFGRSIITHVIDCMCYRKERRGERLRGESVFAGNRDEFLNRPTAKAHFWPSPDSNVLAGTDLEQTATPLHNGTWLGITKDGRFAALTNYREKKYWGKLSRGALVRDFLTSRAQPMDYMHQIAPKASDYGGFSLICLDLKKPSERGSMAYFTNREEKQVFTLSGGTVYGNVYCLQFFRRICMIE